MKTEIVDMAKARHWLAQCSWQIKEVSDYLNNSPKIENKPTVGLSDGGSHYVRLTIDDITGPDMDNPWLVLLQILAAFQEGRGRINIQRNARDCESRMTQLAPPDLLKKMIQTLKEQEQ